LTTDPHPSGAGRPGGTVEFQDGAIQIDAELIADGFKLDPAAVPALLRDGAITSLCERGVGEDAGRYRLTFFHHHRRLRVVVDEAGRVVRQAVVDFGDRPLPAALHKPGS